MVKSDQQPTAQARIKAWVKEQKDGQTEIKAPELANLALQAFAADSELLLSLGRETLRTTVYRLALMTLAETRDGLADVSEDVTSAVPADRVAVLRKKFQDWMEHSLDSHRSLLSMNREQLFAAAAERRDRANAEIEIAKFLEALGRRLKGKQTVGERFKPEEIEFIRQSMKSKQDGKEEAA